jgi:hypothetical protein
MSAPNTIQDLIKAQLLRNNFFSGEDVDPVRPVPIIVSDDGDIANTIEKATSVLGGGLAITIFIPVGRNPNPQSQAVIPELTVEISATENVLINRSANGFNKKGYTAIRKIMAKHLPTNQGGLHFWNPGAPFTRFEFQEFGEFFDVRSSALTSAGRTAGKGLLVYRAFFKTTEAIA